MKKQIGIFLSALALVLLLIALVAGFVAASGKGSIDLHTNVGFVAGLVSIGAHLLWGGGLNFLATFFLITVLGTGLSGSIQEIPSTLHPALAILGWLIAILANTKNLYLLFRRPGRSKLSS